MTNRSATRLSRLVPCLLLSSLLSLAAMASAGSDPVEVGRTIERCNWDETVTFREAKGGAVKIKRGETRTFDLIAPVREIEWYCEDSQEFSSNDEPYDRMRVGREGGDSDKMTLVFLRQAALAAPGEPGDHGVSTQTGDSADACDGDDLVRFQGLHGEVQVKASESVMADLPKPVHELRFSCGSDTGGRVANDNPFDRVRVSRAENGAITWVFYLKTAAADPVGVCDTVRAHGRFFYRNERGDSVPLARVQVKLMNEDLGPTDQEMAVGRTDGDGRFDVTGKGGDSGCTGAGCRRPDPYVEFVLYEAHRVDVRDPLGNTARQKSPTRVNSCGDIDFGDQEWSEAESDPILFANTQTAYDRFTQATHDQRVPGHDGLVEVEFPTVLTWDTPFTTWHTIHWPSNWNPIALAGIPVVNTGDPADNFDAIYHEFGHRLRHTADGDETHFNWDMTRFQYARSHNFELVSNDGFAFNEGWAEYHKSLFADIVSVPKPDGTWESSKPQGDNVEGDVSNQLFILSRDCGGFPKLWATMKGAGPNAFHSIDQFRAEFMQRNPLCGAKIRRPIPVPGGLPGQGSAGGGGQPPPSSGHASVLGGGHGAGSPTAPTGSSADGSGLTTAQLAQLEPRVRVAVEARIKAVEGHRPLASQSTTLRAPLALPAASRSVVQRLLERRVAIDQAWHDEVTVAYRGAIEGLEGLPIESLADGSYEAKRKAAVAVFGGKVTAARTRRLQAVRADLLSERSHASEPKLRAYLDSELARFQRAGGDPHVGDPHLPVTAGLQTVGATTPADQLPRSFWGTTRPRRQR